MPDKNQQWYEHEFWNWIPTEFSWSDAMMAKSESYLANAPVLRNQPYGDDPSEVFDVFIPTHAKDKALPVLIFIHGGYWQWMDKDTYAFSLEPIRAAGAIVVSVNYTLCPENSVGGIIDQVRRACAHVYRNIAEHNGDPENIHVTGHSAGGHLTAMVVATDWQDVEAGLPTDLVKSAIPSSGIFDMNNMRLTPQINEGLRLDEESANACSPLFMTPSHDLRVSVVVGADESGGFLLESQSLVNAWASKLSNVEYVEIPNVHHFSLIDNMVNDNDPFTNVIIEHLGLEGS